MAPNVARYSTLWRSLFQEPDPLNVTDAPLSFLVVQDGSNVQFKWLYGLWNDVILRCIQFLHALLSILLSYKSLRYGHPHYTKFLVLNHV